jgi:hypothetical protein
MAKRKQLTSEEDLLETSLWLFQNLAGLVLLGGTKPSNHHPMLDAGTPEVCCAAWDY